MSEPMDDLGLADVLARLAQLDEEIKETGVSKANVRRLRTLLAEYDELEAALNAKRQKQFWDTAGDWLIKHKIASGRNSADLSLFLRRFAMHVVHEAVAYLDVTIPDIAEVVDHIPEMDASEAEAEDE